MTGKGRIHIYYGFGKGKTTAAVGQIIRAAGCGLKILMFQYLKNNDSNERNILEQIPNITCLPGRQITKFVNQMNKDEKADLKHYNTKAPKAQEYFDEIEKEESLRGYFIHNLKEIATEEEFMLAARIGLNALLGRKTDFVKLADAFGLKGERVTTVQEFEKAFSNAYKTDNIVFSSPLYS